MKSFAKIVSIIAIHIWMNKYYTSKNKQITSIKMNNSMIY